MKLTLRCLKVEETEYTSIMMGYRVTFGTAADKNVLGPVGCLIIESDAPLGYAVGRAYDVIVSGLSEKS